MKAFAALMRLQLLSRYANLKPQNIKAQLKEKKGKTLLQLLGIAVLVICLLVFLVGLENAIMTALIPMGLQDLLISLAVMLGVLGTLVMAFFYVMSALYFNRDAVLMAALPIRTRTLLAARLTQVWLSETGVNALIMLPAGIIFGIRTGADALFYVRLVIVWLTLSILPIAVVSWISTLLIRLSSLWKRRETIATVFGMVLLMGYMLFCMNTGALIGEGGEASEMLTQLLVSQQSRIRSLSTAFPPMRWAANGLLGGASDLLLFVGVSLIAAGVTIWGISRFYRPLSLLQGETTAAPTRRVKGALSYRPVSPFIACCRREWKSLIRVPSYAVNTLPTAILPAFMIAAMYFGIVQSGGASPADFEQLKAQFPGGLIVAIMTALMSYMSGINPAASTAVTREGRGHDTLMSLPISHKTYLLAKLAVGFGISLAGTALGTALLVVLFPAFAVHALQAFLLSTLYNLSTTMLALARDAKHPRLDWVTEMEAIKQQSGVLIGLLISWGLLVALALLSYFVLSLDISMYAYTAIISAVLLVLCWFSYRRLIKTDPSAGK